MCYSTNLREHLQCWYLPYTPDLSFETRIHADATKNAHTCGIIQYKIIKWTIARFYGYATTQNPNWTRCDTKGNPLVVQIGGWEFTYFWKLIACKSNIKRIFLQILKKYSRWLLIRKQTYWRRPIKPTHPNTIILKSLYRNLKPANNIKNTVKL